MTNAAHCRCLVHSASDVRPHAGCSLMYLESDRPVLQTEGESARKGVYSTEQ